MKSFALIIGTTLFAILGGVLYFLFDTGSAFKDNKLNDDFHLVTHDGGKFTMRSLYDRPSIVIFGFTHCSDVCPNTLSKLDKWLKQVDPTGTLLHSYFITVDPKRDTPEVMKKFVTRFSDRIIGVSGDPISVMSVAKRFRIYVNNVLADKSDPEKKYFVDHTTALLLFNNSGNVIGVIAYKESSDSAIKKINRLIESNKPKSQI